MVVGFEIPLIPGPQKIAVSLGSLSAHLLLSYKDTDEGGWVLDILDSQDAPILTGLPLVIGADLLHQYGYLGFEGQLIVQSDTNPGEVPSFTNLGVTSHLYWVPN